MFNRNGQSVWLTLVSVIFFLSETKTTNWLCLAVHTTLLRTAKALKVPNDFVTAQ